jgi:hypothetical protein
MKNKGIGRLHEVIKKIDDPAIKEIVEGVFKVEISYRSAERSYFPRKKLNDVIESTARRIESNNIQTTIDEVSEN